MPYPGCRHNVWKEDLFFRGFVQLEYNLFKAHLSLQISYLSWKIFQEQFQSRTWVCPEDNPSWRTVCCRSWRHLEMMVTEEARPWWCDLTGPGWGHLSWRSLSTKEQRCSWWTWCLMETSVVHLPRCHWRCTGGHLHELHPCQLVLPGGWQWNIGLCTQNCIHKLELNGWQESWRICRCIWCTSGRSGTQHTWDGTLPHSPCQHWWSISCGPGWEKVKIPWKLILTQHNIHFMGLRVAKSCLTGHN